MKEMQPPLVSVVIAAYNVQACLARAVESVLAQDFQQFEVLVVDDGSADATVEVARQLAARDPRIRVFRLGRNQGPSAARNLGIEHARGEWVSILDADDTFLPHRLGHLVDLAQRRSADMVGDNMALYDLGARQVLPATAFGWTEEWQLGVDALLAREGSGGSPLGWVQPLWRVAFLRANRLAYPTQYRYMEDFFLLASALLSGAKAWLSPQAGYVYTLRHGPLSNEASTLSATRANPADAGAVCRDLIDRYCGVLTRDQARGLRRISRRVEAGQAMAEALAARRQRGLLAALFLLRGHPEAACRLALGGARELARSLRRRAAT